MAQIPQLGMDERNMRGRVVVVTGASSGIGAAAARSYADRGAHVIVVGRDAGKTALVAGAIGSDHRTADFAQLRDVSQLGADLLNSIDRIDVLVNNVGAMFERNELTVDGFERTFQVNYLAPFLLTSILRVMLEDSGSDVRVVNTGSSQAIGVELDIDASARGSAPFSKIGSYGAAKLALTYFTERFDRTTPDNLTATIAHPGFVATAIVRDNPAQLAAIRDGRVPDSILTPEQGAGPLVSLGVTRSTAELHGKYFDRYDEHPLEAVSDQAVSSDVWRRSVQLLAASSLTTGQIATQ